MGTNQKDQSRLDELDDMVAAKAYNLLACCEAIGLSLVIVDAYRSFAEQDRLYAQGRTQPGKIVTNAKSGESPHNFRLAFDVAFKRERGGVSWDEPREGAWNEVGKIGETCGLRWGGRFKSFSDRPHFEEPQWKKLAQGRMADTNA